MLSFALLSKTKYKHVFKVNCLLNCFKISLEIVTASDIFIACRIAVLMFNNPLFLQSLSNIKKACSQSIFPVQDLYTCFHHPGTLTYLSVVTLHFLQINFSPESQNNDLNLRIKLKHIYVELQKYGQYSCCRTSLLPQNEFYKFCTTSIQNLIFFYTFNISSILPASNTRYS